MGAQTEIGGLVIRHSGPAPYSARSASDRNPAWPIWFVADATGFNGLQIEGSTAKLLDPEGALVFANALNAAARTTPTQNPESREERS